MQDALPRNERVPGLGPLLTLTADRRTLLAMLALSFVPAGCSSGSKSGSGTPVPANERIPDRVLRDNASFAGTYAGRWAGSDGSSGTAQVDVSIDVTHRSAQARLAIGAGFFGTGSAAASETQTFDLNDYAYERPPYHVTSSVFGPVTLTGPGSGFVRIDSRSVPGHSEIASLFVMGTLTGPDVLPNGDLPFQYEIHRTDGKVVSGTLAFHPPGG